MAATCVSNSGRGGAERGEINARRLRVHHGHLVLAGELHHAKFRPVRAFAHELGVDGHEALAAEPGAEGVERVGGGDQVGWRKFRPVRFRHDMACTRGRSRLKAAAG
jgi:hypothetical protein